MSSYAIMSTYKIWKDDSVGNLSAYKKQRNLCFELLRQSKNDFYDNPSVKIITSNRNVCQTIKPNFTDKTVKDKKITLADGDKVITEEKSVVKKLKDHFEKILKTLQIDRLILSDLRDDPVLNAIENVFHHVSVRKIKEARNSSDCFYFKLVTIEDICKEMLALNSSKATQSDDMPTTITKKNSDIFQFFSQQTLIILL